jgi:membrane-associated PAP2 superfamily phosphatase
MVNQHYIRKGWLLLAFIFAGLVLATGLAIHWNLDRLIVGQFYSPEHGWHLRHVHPWVLIYKYGTVPGLVLTIAALVGWFVCLTKPNYRHMHRLILVVVLTAVLGPGVLVNGILKNYWGRPRPRQVQEFGGQWGYRDISQPGMPGKGKSFPCGHCTMGFLFCSLIAFKRRSALLAIGGGVLGVSWGAAISLTRIIQGAHFPTDALWSLGIVLLLTVALYYLILQVPKPRMDSTPRLSRTQKRLLTGVLVVSALVIGIGFMLHRPFYQTHTISINIPTDIRQVAVSVNQPVEKLNTIYSAPDNSKIVLDAWGFAWLGVKHRCSANTMRKDHTLYIDLRVTRKGYYAELTHELHLYMPTALEHHVTVTLDSHKDQTQPP